LRRGEDARTHPIRCHRRAAHARDECGRYAGVNRQPAMHRNSPVDDAGLS
jgi:hypothetical protein